MADELTALMLLKKLKKLATDTNGVIDSAVPVKIARYKDFSKIDNLRDVVGIDLRTDSEGGETIVILY